MKITVKNIEQEYPKIKAKHPEPLSKEKFDNLVTKFLPNYDKSEIIKKMVDTFVIKLNEVVAKQEPKEKVHKNVNKSTSKAKKPVTKKATSKKSETKRNNIEAINVEHFTEDVRLLRRFFNCIGKERQRRTVLHIYRDFERRITERKANKNSKHAELVKQTNNKLAAILDNMAKQHLTHVKIDVDEAFKSKLDKATKEVAIRTSVNLLKRFIGIEGETRPDKAKVKRIHTAFKNALDSKKITNKDFYAKELSQAYKAMGDYLHENTDYIAIEPTTLSGFELGKSKAPAKKSGGKKSPKVDKRSLTIVNEEFNTDLDIYIENKHKGTEFDLGFPSKLLQNTGLEKLPIKLAKGTLTLKKKKHKFNIELLKDLPKKLANPIFVFDSKHKSDKEFGVSKLVVIGGKVPNEGVLSVVISKSTYNKYVINKIDSIGGRNAKQLWYNIEGGSMLHYNKAKVLTELPDSSIVSDSNSQDFVTKILHHLGITNNQLSGVENEPIVYNRFQVDITPKSNEQVPEEKDNSIQDKPMQGNALNGLFTPITENAPESNHDKIELPGDLGKFLGYVERYEYAILLRGEKGAGKTRLTYQMMNTFAKAGFTVGCFTLEIGKNSNLVKDMRDQYLSPAIASKVQIAEACPNGLSDIKAAAKAFDVVVIDSWGKIPNTKQDDFDKLRKEHPNTMFVVIFQSTTNGTARGGSMPEYDAGVVIQVQEGGKAICEKNRYSGEDLTYLVFEKKLAQSNTPEEAA